MRIGLDVMGGDYAPEAVIEGAVDSLRQLADNEKLVLIGVENSILSILSKLKVEPSLFEIIAGRGTYYVVAYDTAHAITSLIEKWSSVKDIKSVKKLTDDIWNLLFVAKECLPQGLVNKTIENE